MIGGSGERKTLRLVAEYADIWHSFANPLTLDHKLEVLREHCDAVGRDMGEIELSNELRGADEEQADELYARGVTLYTIGISGPYDDLERVNRWLAWRDAKNA
jgi:alkanesulfonate monooxygenase SsuD/methylene tetrahydromethanopterin reductase-like flavin-dependent oxidoreductase (luciferase family)